MLKQLTETKDELEATKRELLDTQSISRRDIELLKDSNSSLQINSERMKGEVFINLR